MPYSEDLPGVYGVGTSMEEAKTGILDAIRIYILQSKKTGRPLPLRRISKLLVQY
jgi:predicted RNase H-like HicB family nuclease